MGEGGGSFRGPEGRSIPGNMWNDFSPLVDIRRAEGEVNENSRWQTAAPARLSRVSFIPSSDLFSVISWSSARKRGGKGGSRETGGHLLVRKKVLLGFLWGE